MTIDKEVLLEVKGLRKYFPVISGILRRTIGEIKAVDGIDFSIHSGEVLGIVGESGSGKSTAARTAIRLIEPTEGQINFLGQSILSFLPSQMLEFRKKVQIVFQDPFSSLNPRKTIMECIGEPLIYHGIVSSHSEMVDRVVDILINVGLTAEALTRFPHEFSGGQQQRICIGRAISLNPRLLICDEAVSALDVSVQAQILNLLNHLKEKFHFSYLFISHDLSIIRHISDRIAVMYLGKIVETGSIDEVFNFPKHAYTKALLSSVPKSHPKYKKKFISF